MTGNADRAAPAALTTGLAREADRAAWDAFVTARPEADVLQLWAWGDLTGGERGERPIRLVARSADGSLRGVAQALVRRTTLGRTVAYVPHGPVWDRRAPDAGRVLDALLDGLRRLGRDERAIVVKVDPRALVGHADEAVGLAGALERRGLRRSPFDLQAATTRVVTIEPEEAARIATWSGDARNRWRRAAREGTMVDVVREPDPRVIGDFVDLLERTSRRAGFGIHARAFYADLATALAGRHRFHLAVARTGGRAIAGAYAAGLGDRSFYLYGASDHDAPRHAYGSYAGMGALLAALAEDGIRTLDMWGVLPDGAMPATSGDAGWAGFSEFKARFGGTPIVHPGTFDLVIDPFWWQVRRVRERLLGRTS